MKVDRPFDVTVSVYSKDTAEIDAIQRALEQPHILKSLHTLGVALLLDDRLRTLRTPHKKTTFSVRVDHEDAMPVVVHLENK